MNTKEEILKSIDQRERFKAALQKRRFPTIVSVLSMSDETSKMMKEEHRRKAKEALQKRRAKP
jgi:hypothetical protein